MPRAADGKHFLNKQLADAHDKAPARKTGVPAGPSVPKEETAQAVGDLPEQDPVHAHLSAMHAADGGKHMHVSSDGMGFKSHQIGDSGEPEGPMQHESADAMAEHMKGFMGDGSQDMDMADDYGGADMGGHSGV